MAVFIVKISKYTARNVLEHSNVTIDENFIYKSLCDSIYNEGIGLPDVNVISLSEED